jgi:hypothetical protein
MTTVVLLRKQTTRLPIFLIQDEVLQTDISYVYSGKNTDMIYCPLYQI